MQVGMEDAKAESVAEEIGDHVRAEDLRNESLGAQAASLDLIVVLDEAQIGRHARPVEILHGQDALAAESPEDLRYLLDLGTGGVVAEHLGVGSFAAVVELVEGPGGKLRTGSRMKYILRIRKKR